MITTKDPIDESQHNIIRKIQKLFNLAQHKDGNETQAAAALDKAHKMLAEHNLSLSIVQDTVVDGGVQNGCAVQEEKREKTTVKRSAMYKWQRRLWYVLSETNYCFHWVRDVAEEVGFLRRRHWWEDAGTPKVRDTRTSYVKRHIVLGRESNVAVVTLMGEYICDTIERLCAEQYPKSEILSRSAISWREGVADRLIERLYEKAAQEEFDQTQDAEANKYALALRDVRMKEYEKNYDAVLGAGAYQKKQQQEKEAAEARLKYEQMRIEMLQNESPEAKKRREVEEEKMRVCARVHRERNYRRQKKERVEDYCRTDWSAYDRGKEDGNRINLSSQVSKSKQPSKELPA